MVDILGEVGDGSVKKRKPVSVVVVVCIIAAVVAAGLVVYFLFGRADPPVGRELSVVSGVGIVRRGRLQGTQTVKNEIKESGSSKIYRDGYELICALCDATDQEAAIVQKGALPKGKYRVSVSTNRGGQATLLRMLVRAYSDSFGVNVSEKEIETDVYVMTCPNPSRLGFKRSVNRVANFDGDFRGGGAGNMENTRFDCEFTAEMGDLADYAGYMIRKSWERLEPTARDKAIATVIVDETGLDGLYTGRMSWRFYVPGALMKELGDKGLKFTKARRKVKVVVIEQGR